jgi:hypothetical protein
MLTISRRHAIRHREMSGLALRDGGLQTAPGSAKAFEEAGLKSRARSIPPSAAGGLKPYLFDGGLPNIAASTGIFDSTLLIWIASRPSSHAKVRWNGIMIPPASR